MSDFVTNPSKNLSRVTQLTTEILSRFDSVGPWCDQLVSSLLGIFATDHLRTYRNTSIYIHVKNALYVCWNNDLLAAYQDQPTFKGFLRYDSTDKWTTAVKNLPIIRQMTSRFGLVFTYQMTCLCINEAYALTQTSNRLPIAEGLRDSLIAIHFVDYACHALELKRSPSDEEYQWTNHTNLVEAYKNVLNRCKASISFHLRQSVYSTNVVSMVLSAITTMLTRCDETLVNITNRVPFTKPRYIATDESTPTILDVFLDYVMNDG